jgi:hypothetical protein
MNKRTAVWSHRISEKLHQHLLNMPESEDKRMNQEIDDIMMRYAFVNNNDFRSPYCEDER